MKAIAVFPGQSDTVHLADLKKPSVNDVPNGRGVLVRILKVGVDGTDKEINAAEYGAAPNGYEFLVIGHEGLGQVEEVGPNVTEFKPGDYVVATVRRPGNSLYDKIGTYDMTTDNEYFERGISRLHGFLTEYYVDDPEYIVKIPQGLKDVAVLLEPMTVVQKGIVQAYEIQRRLKVWRPRTAAVMGAGTIGLLATLVLRLRGLQADTFARSPKPSRNADLIESLGAHYHATQQLPFLECAKECGPYDIIFEATGNSAVVFDAMQGLAKNGVLVLASVTGGDKTIEIPADRINLDFVLGNKVMVGTVNANREYFESGVRDMAQSQAEYPGWLPKLLTNPVHGSGEFRRVVPPTHRRPQRYQGLLRSRGCHSRVTAGSRQRGGGLVRLTGLGKDAMIAFDENVCRELDHAAQREWLETNGIGGFAGSTIVGMNTRRYHGLLVASLKPPVERYVLLSKLEETLLVDGVAHELSVNQYPGAVHPQGHRYLKAFRFDPFPVFTYEVQNIEVEKRVFLVHGENTVVVQYRVGPNRGHFGELQLIVRPLVAFRDYHSTTHENTGLNPHVKLAEGQAVFQPYASLPGLHFAHNAVAVEPQGDWFRNFEYAEERKRGLNFHEDLYNPCALRFDLSQTRQATVIASLEPRNVDNAGAYELAERQRRKSLVEGIDDDFACELTAAADQFIVARGSARSIIAGYPWFADWGRDTMIALPGLTLATGRYDVARSILLEFACYVDRGMLPNRFPDAGETPEYNTADATLWFFEAIRQYIECTNDYDVVRQKLYPVLTSIIDFHISGTRYGIKVDRDGLLNCGEPGVQLTWMDAKIGDWVVTPRYGKPVEIQALWYNALRTMHSLATAFHDLANKKLYTSLASQAASSFNAEFWNTEEDCLFDVVGRDAPRRLDPP